MMMWMTTLTISLCAIIISAGMGEPTVHMAMSGLVSLAMALLAIRENMSMRASGSPPGLVASSTARYMGLVWVWAALSLLVTYLFILQWPEWWQFFLALTSAGVLCLFFAATLEKDAETGRKDLTMINLARYLTIGQLIGMAVAAIGLWIDPDKHFLDVGHPDWAANSIFFFGALSIAAISLHALIYNEHPKA